MHEIIAAEEEEEKEEKEEKEEEDNEEYKERADSNSPTGLNEAVRVSRNESFDTIAY